MWAEFELPLSLRIKLRKLRLLWRESFGLKWLAAWAVALIIYLAVGLQPAEAINYQIAGQLSIPAAGLTAAVTELKLENGELRTPDALVGSYQRHPNKTLLIGHSTGVFAQLKMVQAGEQIVYNGTIYNIYSKEIVAKSEVDMRELLKSEEKETLVLMTCAGELLNGGDATERLIVKAVKES